MTSILTLAKNYENVLERTSDELSNAFFFFRYDVWERAVLVGCGFWSPPRTKPSLLEPARNRVKEICSRYVGRAYALSGNNWKFLPSLRIVACSHLSPGAASFAALGGSVAGSSRLYQHHRWLEDDHGHPDVEHSADEQWHQVEQYDVGEEVAQVGLPRQLEGALLHVGDADVADRAELGQEDPGDAVAEGEHPDGEDDALGAADGADGARLQRQADGDEALHREGSHA